MREMHSQLWSENLKERHHLRNLGVDERIVLQQIGVRMWTGVNWLRTDTSGVFL